MIKRIRVIIALQERLILILSAAYIFSILQEKEKKKEEENKNNETCYFDNFNISSFKIGK